MSEFKHRKIKVDELNSPDIRKLLNNAELSKYRNEVYTFNNYFTLKELLAILQTTLGDYNAELLLKKNSQLTISLFSELCIDLLEDQGEPAKDLQMTFMVNFIRRTIKDAGNNVKLFRKRIREAVEEFELEEPFSSLVQENIMDKLKYKNEYIFIYRF